MLDDRLKLLNQLSKVQTCKINLPLEKEISVIDNLKDRSAPVERHKKGNTKCFIPLT